jgi:uncharacterized protein YdeI (YjbR/CyaY-like superfamily)
VRYTPKSRKAWRAWLTQNHEHRDEVWLVFYKRHTGKPTLSYNDAVEEAICFGWIDGVKQRIDAERYMHRFTPRMKDSNWSDSNKKRVERMAKAELMMPAGERAVQRAEISGTWKVLAPQVDFEMPPELEARLNRNVKAKAAFEALAPSYQRQYVGWIASAKREDTRKKRVAEAIKLLSRGEKLGMR